MSNKDCKGASGCFGVAHRGACCTPCGCRFGGHSGGTATGRLVYSTTPAMTARPIPTSHPVPVCCSLRCNILEQRELSGSSSFGASGICCFATAVHSLFLVASKLKTASFAAASSAISASFFCRRASAPLRPASCFLGSFVFTAVWRGNVFSACSGCSESIVVVSTRCNIIVEAVVFNTTPVTVLSGGQRSG